MTTTVKPKAPRNGVTKKPTPKSKAHAQRLNGTLVAGENRPPSQTSTTLPDGVAALDKRVKLSRPVDFDDIADLRCDWLARHPANRVPAEEAIAARAVSLQEEGQLEPLVVREWEDAQDERIHFQIISGETRWLAAQRIGWKTIACRVVKDCDDVRALELLAHYNGERTDLNPMQRAQLIQHLCKPVEEGGAGNTREEAARAVGLNSGSAASNLVRLLELPQVWQDRVANGELPESFARLLVPICKAPGLMAEMEKEWKEHLRMPNDDWADNFRNRDVLEETIDDVILSFSRPINSDSTFSYNYSVFGKNYSEANRYTGEHPLLFEITDKLRDGLEIIELPIREGKKTRTEPRATNVDLYDKHQIPAIKAKVDGKAKQGANAAAAKDEKPAKKKLTAAQQKKLDAERVEKLAMRIEAWRHRWLCEIVAREIEHHPIACRALVAWMMTTGAFSYWELDEVVTETLEEYQGQKIKDAESIWPYFYSVKTSKGYPEDVALTAIARFALLKEDKNPRDLALKEVIDNLAARCQIDLAAEWRKTHFDQADEANLPLHFHLFLGLHTSDQLDALGEELGVYTGGVSGKSKKAELFNNLLRPLPMPKAIRPLVDPTIEQKKTPAKKGAARKKAAKKK